MPDPDDRAASTVAEIRDRNIDAYADGSTSDIPRLIKAVEAALKLAGDWESESDELDNEAERPGTDDEAAPICRGEAIAYHSCAADLREAITAALAGDGES
jgi:hypothetical protein